MTILYNPFGGLEVYFDYVPSDTRSVVLRCSALGLSQDEAIVENWWEGKESTKGISVEISSLEANGATSVICQTKINSVTIDKSSWSTGSPNVSTLKCKIIIAVAAVSVYCNGTWIYSYVFKDIAWPEVPKIWLKTSSAFQLRNIKRSELSDRREAVYIDYEATTESGIQSVIQQRPVQIFPEVGRANAYTYSATRGIVNAHHINTYDETTRDNQMMSSDGLVYYRNVGVSISRSTAAAVGLVTKLYRLSELDNGAIESASRIQKLALERRKMISISMRLDPRIEIADRMLIDLHLTGTNTHLVDDVVIEDISISMQNGSYMMQISARRKQ